MDRQTPYVRSFMARSNMEVMERISIFVTVLAALALISTSGIAAGLLWQNRTDDVMLAYRIQFALVVVTNLAFGTLGRHMLAKPKVEPRPCEVMLLAYTVIMCSLSVWVTVIDYATIGRYFFLLVSLFVVFGLFFIPPVQTLAWMIVIYTAMLGGIGQRGLMDVVQVVILTVYLLVTVGVSASNYASRLRVAMTDEQILAASRHDSLTGVLNRRAFDEDARTLVGQPLFVLLTDIDGFKYYNDLYGHAAGDELVRFMADILTVTFGAGTVYRFGGDEFIVAQRSDNAEEFRRGVEDFRERFVAQAVPDKKTRMTCSGGCVEGFVEKESDVHDLLRVADMLLFQSKDKGRDLVTYATYSDGLLREAFVYGYAKGEAAPDTDQLTGLPGFESFVERASVVAPDLISHGQSVSFAYFNVTSLKDYNSRNGYAEGDRLLKTIAGILTEVFPSSMATRYEDRFIVMCGAGDVAAATANACTLAGDLGNRVTTLQAGVFRYTDPEVGVRYAIDCARIACDSLSGRYDVSWCYYTADIGAKWEQRNRVLERFVDALERGDIRPYYHPIVRSVSDLVSEFEILARWIDPQEGLLAPDTFIPHLENAHLIHLLDLHIVEEVCQNFRRLKDAGLPVCPVSVNFSRLDFLACDLPTEVIGLLDKYGVEHELVRVELTESAFAEESDVVKQSLDRFREAGMQVWMDDFGSGYSALNVLREYRFDLVKFDMIFLRGMDTDNNSDRSAIMLTALVSLVKELGLQTLVEGVETIEQMRFLRAIACEKLQGYVYSKPMSYDELCEGLVRGTFPVEVPEKRSYFDRIGTINLMRPVESGSTVNPNGIAEGVPCAILEYADGHLRYLELNEAYSLRLAAAGIVGGKESASSLNAALADEASCTSASLRSLMASSDWCAVELDVSPTTTLVGYGRVVARVEEIATCAILFFMT